MKPAERRARQYKQSAHEAGLRYVNDNEPGITRKRRGKAFIYVHSSGKRVTDAPVLKRITSLVIPPAYEDVWICSDPRGHLQATGRDERGRKQSRYQSDFRAVREQSKFDHVIGFAKALPKLRRTVARDLRRKGLPRRKVLAAVVQMLEKTLVRIGNDTSANEDKHFGLTTIENRHVKVNGNGLSLNFVGKSGKPHQIKFKSKTLAIIVRKCQDLPGQQLFGYVDDDGQVCDVKSTDVNDYLRDISAQDITAKDFRTFTATVLVAQALAACASCDSLSAVKKNIVSAIEQVAKKLGNTRTVCRKCYVHPAILNAYMDGTTIKVLNKQADALRSTTRLSDDETQVVRLLKKAMKRLK